MLSKDGQRLTIAFEGKVGYANDGKFKQTHCKLKDITEKRKAERALEESEKRYRDLNKQSRTFTWEVDEWGKFINVDYASELVLGYRPEELIREKSYFDLIVNEDKDDVRSYFDSINKNIDDYRNVEMRAYTKSGLLSYLSSSWFPVYREDGAFLYYLGSSTDITSIKKIEEALLKSERRFRMAQDSSPDGFTLLHPERDEFGKIVDFVFVYENEAIAKVNHTDPHLVVGKKLLDLFPSHKGTSIFDSYIHVAETAETQVIEEVNVGDIISDPKWLRLVIVSMEDDIAILAHDITRRKKASVELARIMSQNQRILDNLQDSYVQTDVLGRIIKVNPQTLTLFGYSSVSDLIGQPFEILCPDKKHLEDVFIELKEEIRISDSILKGIRKDGSEFWISSNIQYINDEAEMIGIEMLSRDVTERLTMQEEIKIHRDNLIISNKKLDHLFEQSIQTISKIGELRDAYTAGHQRRVKDLACEIAKFMNLSEEVQRNLSYGSLIHDIGKIYVPAEILNKPGKITSVEFQMIQSHVELGYLIIKNIDFPNVISMMVYQHHERMDGSGYQNAIKGHQIILESRILAVADVVEAISSHRPYRPALGIDAALEEILKLRGVKFDSRVVDACVQLFRENGFLFDRLV